MNYELILNCKFYISKFSHFQIFIFIILFLLSCHNSRQLDEKYSIFRYNESAGITSLDPAFAKDQANIWACNQLYNGLVQLDDELYIKPCIAKSWEISKDGLTYIFHLRNDVYFHTSEIFKIQNPTPTLPLNKEREVIYKVQQSRRVVADDFVYSFNRIADPGLASPGAWVFNDVKQYNEQRTVLAKVGNNEQRTYAFTALNDSTLKIELKEPFPPFLGILSMLYCSVVPHEIVEYYGKNFRKNPVGTGSFRFKLWKEGVKLVLVKNENYFEKDDLNGGRLPYLDAVNITFIADKQTAFLEFVKGNIDFISGIDQSYKDELLTRYGNLSPKYRERFTMLKQPYLNTEYFGFLINNNEAGSTMHEIPELIRKAINYGIDRKKMLRYLRNNIGKPGLNGMIPPGLPSYDSTRQFGYDYIPEKAKQLLAHAGYPNGKGLSDITLSTTSSYLDLCKYMQHELSEIGIKLNIDVVPPATLREFIAKSKVTFFRGSWIADYPDAENYLSLFLSKNFCPQGPNYTHFKNIRFDELYDKAQHEVNDNVRYDYYRQMDRLVMEEAPVMVLYYDEVLRFTRKNITCLGNNPMNLLTLKRVRKIKD